VEEKREKKVKKEKAEEYKFGENLYWKLPE